MQHIKEYTPGHKMTLLINDNSLLLMVMSRRSEERRVGKEC